MHEKDAAPFAGTTPGYLRKLRSEGRGPAYVKLGRRVAYLPSDLKRYIDSNRRNVSQTDAR